MAPAAARITDIITHTFALGGILAGALIGALIGVATVATGGLALGPALVAAGAGASLGGTIGELAAMFIPPIPTGPIAAVGAPRTLIGNLPAARAVVDMVACTGMPFVPLAPPHPVPIAEGSATVFIEGFPAARKDDKISCGAVISMGCSSVIIEGGSAQYMEVDSEVPAWVHYGLLALGLVSGVGAIGLAAKGTRLLMAAKLGAGLLGGIGGTFGGHVLGGHIFGEGSRGQKVMGFVGGLIGGILGFKAIPGPKPVGTPPPRAPPETPPTPKPPIETSTPTPPTPKPPIETPTPPAPRPRQIPQQQQTQTPGVRKPSATSEKPPTPEPGPIRQQQQIGQQQQVGVPPKKPATAVEERPPVPRQQQQATQQQQSGPAPPTETTPPPPRPPPTETTPPASAPVGRKVHKKVFESTGPTGQPTGRPPVTAETGGALPDRPPFQPRGNQPTNIMGRDYTGHALDRMQQRGFTPSVVENTITHGTSRLEGGERVYFDPINRVRVATDARTGRVTDVTYAEGFRGS